MVIKVDVAKYFPTERVKQKYKGRVKYRLHVQVYPSLRCGGLVTRILDREFNRVLNRGLRLSETQANY